MDAKAALIAFVEDYLKSVRVPVHRVILPCGDYTWLDWGLRAASPDGRGYQFIQTYLASVEENTIYQLLDAFGCQYTIFRLPDSAELMVCGPVMFGDEGFPARTAPERLSFPRQAGSVLQDFYRRVTVFRHPMTYYNIFKTLGSRIYGDELRGIVNDNLNDLGYWYETYQQNLSEEESTSRFQAVERWYSMETELIKALCNGDESSILDAASILQSLALPRLLADELRDTHACMFVLETLLRKAAEISGVLPILIDPYSQRHIQLIGQITGKAEMDAFLMQFIRDYYLLIHQHAIKKYSLLTQKIITLIDRDIAADLGLSAMSKELNANAKYLSALFKREVGVTLTDYVSRRRIELAKRMLIFSDLPIKTIAKKCGMPDIHYFSRLFKKRVGCTPKFFRENYLKTADF